MDIYCLESFKEHMKEVDTERLISYIEGIMTHVLEVVFKSNLSTGF